MPASTKWRKSSFSQGGGSDCIEVAWRKSTHSDRVDMAFAECAAIRDSKSAAGPILTLTAPAFRRFVTQARAPKVAFKAPNAPKVAFRALRAGP
jgi:hypothetical protein